MLHFQITLTDKSSIVKFARAQSLKKDEVEKYLSKAKGRFEFSKPLVMLSLPPSERKRVKALIREALKDYPI